jgi:DNA mismatch repair protein MutS
MTLISDYFIQLNEFQQKYGIKTAFFIQVGAFYEIYGIKNNITNVISKSNIQDIASICELNFGPRPHVSEHGQDNSVVAIGFRDYSLDKYLQKLNNQGYTVVVYDQDEQTKNTTRSLSGIYSPGTFFSTNSTTISNNCCCIWTQFNKKTIKKDAEIIVGISSVDIFTGKSTIFEYVQPYISNTPAIYDELERFLSIYNPSEIIFISNLEQHLHNQAISYANIQCNLLHSIHLLDEQNIRTQEAHVCEKQTYQTTILSQFFSDTTTFLQDFQTYSIATQSYCYLLNFIKTRNSSLVKKMEYPVFENFGQRLLLANHTLKQLNIIDDANYTGEYSSVLKFLNKCITPMGKRKFKYHLLNPVTNIDTLNKEYDITDFLLDNFEMVDFVRKQFTPIKDVEKLYRCIYLQKITPQNLFYFYQNLKSIVEIDTYVSDYPYINKIANPDNNIKDICNTFISLFEKTFVLDLCRNEETTSFDKNFFQYGIYPELDKAVENYIDTMDKLEAIRFFFNSILCDADKKIKNKDEVVKIHETEKMGYSIVSTKKRCETIKKNIKEDNYTISYVSTFDKSTKKIKLDCSAISFHHSTASNNSIHVEQLDKICSSILKYRNTMKTIIYDTYTQFISSLETYHTHFEKIVSYVGLLDFSTCKAYLSHKFNFCKPIIDHSSNKSYVDVTGLRHCLIEQLSEDELYVSNDMILGQETDGILLYGTNAVGKTSFIRALGISVIMAQAGLYVPSSSFTYFPYNQLFSRILNNDNLFQGLSTFAVEMCELRSILNYANKNSLILGDELCSGTEYESAIGIFVSGLQKLHDVKCSFIFATHLHEITNYDEIQQMNKLKMKHMRVIYNPENDCLIYDRKLQDGPGESMYGLEVCKSLHLPQEFMDYAFQIREKYSKYNKSILLMKTSHYNSSKVKGYCENCKTELSTDVHHLQYQQDANEEGFIGDFHKNTKANLMSLCEKCHLEIHKKNKKMKRKKTTKGTVLEEI